MNTEEKILEMLGALTTTVRAIQTEQQKTNQRLDSLEGEVQKTNQRLDRLEDEVQTVKNTVVRIENEHGKKLTALFDGHSMLYDISKEVRNDIAKLHDTQEKQDLHLRLINNPKKL